MTNITATAAIDIASPIVADAPRRDRVSAGSLYPVVRGIVFALPLSLLVWAAILFLSFR